MNEGYLVNRDGSRDDIGGGAYWYVVPENTKGPWNSNGPEQECMFDHKVQKLKHI